jgi:WD40 repeat protein
VLAERSRFRAERDRAQSHLYDSLVSNARAQMKARDTGWWWTATDNLRQAAELQVAARNPAELRDLVTDCISTEFVCFRHVAAWTGHRGSVTASSISPDGTLLATGSTDKTVRIWSVPDGQCRAVLEGHLERVTDVAFTPDGRRLASSCADGAFRIWDVSTLADGVKPQRTIALDAGAIAAIDCATDGRQFAAGCEDGSVFLISNDDSPTPRRLSKEDDEVLTLALQPGKDVVAIASYKQPLRFRDLAEGKELFSHKFGNFMTSIGFSPDGAGMACINPEIWGFSAMSPRANATVAHFGQLHNNSVAKVEYVRQIGPNPVNLLMTTSADGSLRLWQVLPGNAIREIAVARGEFGPALTSSFHSGGRWVLAGYRDGAVRLWEWRMPSERRVLTGGAPALAFLGSAYQLVNPPYVHDVSANVSVYQSAIGYAGLTWGLAPSPDGRHFATASHDGKVRIGDATTQQVVRTIDGHDTLAWSVAYSPDGRLIASGAADIRIWNAATGELVRTINVKHHLVRALAFHPTQNILFAATKERMLRAFDVSTGERIGDSIKLGTEISCLAIRPGGTQLAAGSFDETVMLWDLPDNLREAGLPPKPNQRWHDHRTGIWSVAYSPDGRYLASGSDNGVVLTDPATGARFATLRGIEGQVRSLSFSADGNFLAAALYTRSTIVWNLPAIRRSLAEMGLDW